MLSILSQTWKELPKNNKNYDERKKKKAVLKQTTLSLKANSGMIVVSLWKLAHWKFSFLSFFRIFATYFHGFVGIDMCEVCACSFFYKTSLKSRWMIFLKIFVESKKKSFVKKKNCAENLINFVHIAASYW